MKFLKKIQYNAPVTLTFFLLSLVVLVLGNMNYQIVRQFFSVYQSSLTDPIAYLRLFTHVLGHSGYQHFIGNMLLFLIVAPPLEEKYGSGMLLLGILITAFVSGVLQCIFFPHTALLGASGIVFMLIMLSSLSGMKEGSIPLTLIIVGVLYLGEEVFDALFVRDNIAHFMHLVGGACGTVFGFIAINKGAHSRRRKLEY